MSQLEQSDWRSSQYFIILEILSRPRQPYRGHLVVEFRQRGVSCEVGGVTLEQLQLFMKPVFILFAAVPAAAHGTEQDLAGLAPPLKDHHLRAMKISTFSTNTEYDLQKALCIFLHAEKRVVHLYCKEKKNSSLSGSSISTGELTVGALWWVYVLMHVSSALTWGESAAWLGSRAWQRGCWWRW